MVAGRSLNAKKQDGIKESTDSSATLEDDENRSRRDQIDNTPSVVRVTDVVLHSQRILTTQS